MVAKVDFTSQDYMRDPATAIERLRRLGPVVETKFPIMGKVWITTDSEFAGRVLKDSETFRMRSDKGLVAGLRWWFPRSLRTLTQNMLTMDEPDHTRLRGIVDEAFRRRAVIAMEPHILSIAQGLADKLFEDGSPADVVERFARPLPTAVICELLGLPDDDRAQFMEWMSGMARITGAFSFVRMLTRVPKMKRYLEGRLAATRRNGGEGLIAELVRVEKEGGRISGEEMVAMVFLLFGAGSETTTHLISGAVHELVKEPALRDWMKEDWDRANMAVEEFLRFISPVQFTKPRVVHHDVDLAGAHLKKGDKIMVMVAAANMDPAMNADPAHLDLTRRPNRHMAFGTGIHFCLGHQLARIEGKCALQALFTRWPDLALAIDPDKVVWRERPGLRALEELPVVAAA